MRGPARAGRTKFDLGDIVRDHRADLERVRDLRTHEQRVLTAIERCRTAALGGHLDRCSDCDFERPSYNSCRNRHCPKCQALAQEAWIEGERRRLLPLPHFHVVFTVPAELRPLARFAPRAFYDELFAAVRDTLAGFAKRRLRAQLGATLVLHTWKRDLLFHPHIHAIVSAGGLSLDGERIVRSRSPDYLFPVAALGKVFAAKMKSHLSRAHEERLFAGFSAFDDPVGFVRLLRSIRHEGWNVYAKKPFDDASHVVSYLGRYTHRVGISNSRLLYVTPTAVVFRTKGEGVASTTPVDFLQRFLLHLLPTGFHKIRHIGLYASPLKRSVAAALLGRDGIRAPRDAPARYEPPPRSCPLCRAALLLVPLARAPPSTTP